MKSIVILISSHGSNMEAILHAQSAGNLPLDIRAVISNRPDAKGLATAATHHVACRVVDHMAFAARDEFDAALADSINEFRPDFIVLAGFMRVLGADFIGQFTNRIVNIHPSLLPSFPGLHTHRRAMAAGVKIHGATVHLVTSALDGGPIIAQAAVPVLPGDSEASLAARVLAQEHILYPQVLAWLAAGRLEFLPSGVVELGQAYVDNGEGGDFLRSPRINP